MSNYKFLRARYLRKVSFSDACFLIGKYFIIPKGLTQEDIYILVNKDNKVSPKKSIIFTNQLRDTDIILPTP